MFNGKPEATIRRFIAAPASLQPGGRYISAGGVNHRKLSQSGVQARRAIHVWDDELTLVNQSLLCVSPSGLNQLAAFSPVVDTTGKDLSPSGLRTKVTLRPHIV